MIRPRSFSSEKFPQADWTDARLQHDCATIVGMSATTTIRLSDEERALLGELAEEYGSQTGAIRQGIILLARESRRRRALREFLNEWAQEAGHPDPEDVAEMRRRYFKQ